MQMDIRHNKRSIIAVKLSRDDGEEETSNEMADGRPSRMICAGTSATSCQGFLEMH